MDPGYMRMRAEQNLGRSAENVEPPVRGVVAAPVAAVPVSVPVRGAQPSAAEQVTVKQDATADAKPDVAPDVEPEYRKSTAMAVQSSSGSKRKKTKKPADVPGVHNVRNVPDSVINLAKAEFPNAANGDAIAAYMVVHGGVVTKDLPQSVIDLVEAYEGNRTLMTMEERMSAMESNMVRMANIMREMELGISYLIFLYMGYRQSGIPADIRDVEILESGVSDMVERLREQTKQFKFQDDAKNRTPYKPGGKRGR